MKKGKRKEEAEEKEKRKKIAEKLLFLLVSLLRAAHS